MTKAKYLRRLPQPKRRHRAVWASLVPAVALLCTAAAHGQECAWTLQSSTGPSARTRHGMVYDSGRARVVLFGGFGGTSRLGDTWEWDGLVWTQRATTGPSPRVLGSATALAYDAGRGRVVLFGGYDGEYKGDTWEWDGSAWTQRATTGPSARNAHAMAYDASRRRVVLFGSGGGGDDTWEWDGSAWTERLVSGPSGRGGHGMVYDSARARTVVFGGRSGSDYRSDTWEWDGAAWFQVATTGPSARYEHAMTYDAVRRRMLLFGGYFYDTAPHYYADTWEWDGSAWTQRSDAGAPARSEHTMAYDSARNRTVLFGGFDGTRHFGDTWEWACAYQTEAVSLRVNGDSAATVTASNPVTVDYTIRGGAGREFFLALDAPAMGRPWSFLNATGQWVTLPANLNDVTSFATAPADGDYTLFSGTAPAGNYVLCLGYDTVKNGYLDMGNAVYDCSEATVR